MKDKTVSKGEVGWVLPAGKTLTEDCIGRLDESGWSVDSAVWGGWRLIRLPVSHLAGKFVCCIVVVLAGVQRPGQPGVRHRVGGNLSLGRHVWRPPGPACLHS